MPHPADWRLLLRRIDPSTRLRRAIHLNDPLLVSRLLRTHPSLVQNPDFADKSNTSLHLAASLGLPGIAELLIKAGHEDGGLSRNADHDIPLMLAAKNGNVEVGKLLIRKFPWGINYTNKTGSDALGLASQNPASTSLIPVLLNPASIGAEGGGETANVHVRDQDGNTPLHHASASGSLKALRLILAAGANPLAKNTYDWTPLAYSQTVAAEVYFKNLVAELERRKLSDLKAAEEQERQRAAGMRVVPPTTDSPARDEEANESRDQFPKRSVEIGGSLATPVDDDEIIGDALKRHWSPRGRPGTPGSAGGKTPTHEWDSRLGYLHSRTRSGSGD